MAAVSLPEFTPWLWHLLCVTLTKSRDPCAPLSSNVDKCAVLTLISGIRTMSAVVLLLFSMTLGTPGASPLLPPISNY